MADVRKLYALVVVSPPPASVAVQKAYALAVLHDTAVAPVPVEASRKPRRLGMWIGAR